MTASSSYPFVHLTLKDLVEARDLFHVHLMNKKNVIATAIGKYRVRRDQVRRGRIIKKTRGLSEPKTLQNTCITGESWPCILVFVEDWLPPGSFSSYSKSLDAVPERLFMPDGRIIPVCVVCVEKTEKGSPEVVPEPVKFPVNMLGSGFPLLVQAQGVEHRASAGCLVTDGAKYYVLTNRHVAGDPGSVICANLNGMRSAIGTSSEHQLGIIRFPEAYPGWSHQDMVINADAGLVEVNDIREWKTEVPRLGRLAEPLDLNTHSLNLDLVGRKIRSFGGVSGLQEGEIAALFYRYKSIGGFEYISDFLIGPPDPQTEYYARHGDSGTLLLAEGTGPGGEKEYHPFALLWGCHRFVDAAGHHKDAYGLATNLSTILRMLNLDLVCDWNDDSIYIWGKIGHFSLAQTAVDLLPKRGRAFPDLSRLLSMNLANITFPKEELEEGSKKQNKDFEEACPLSDVPDIIWKSYIKGVTRKPYENPNHYADMDIHSGGDTSKPKLFELFRDKPAQYLEADQWLNFYIAAGKTEARDQGLLPFRVGQIFDEMVTMGSTDDALGFLCAAGVLTHYIGDACMPLHGSEFSNGDPYQYEEVTTSKGTTKKVLRGDGVHAAIDDLVLERNIDIILGQIEEYMAIQDSDPEETIPEILDGRDAVAATVRLMEKALVSMPPQNIIEAYVALKGKSKTEQAAGLWEQFHEPLIHTLARGCRYMIAVWIAAWKTGLKGRSLSDIREFTPGEIMERIRDKEFLKSYDLEGIAALP